MQVKTNLILYKDSTFDKIKETLISLNSVIDVQKVEDDPIYTTIIIDLKEDVGYNTVLEVGRLLEICYSSYK